MSNTNNILKLKDGRNLAYAEFGDPDGYPVILFHGNPGSLFLPNIRIIAPDRPGYGQTDYKRDAIKTWPADVEQLANHPNIKKFALFAPSGGGPFALMCAWKIPHRLASIGIFGSVGPNVAEATEGALGSLKVLWKLSNPLFWAIRLQMWVMGLLATKSPAAFSLRVRDLELSESDKEIFNRLKLQDVFRQEFPEAYRQGGIGSAYDATLPAKWPIPLEQIKMKVHVWHAKEDELVGNMSKYIAERLPNAELIELAGTGHLWIIEHMKDVLEKLVPDVIK